MTATGYYTKVTIGGTDVTRHVYDYQITDSIQERIDGALLNLSTEILQLGLDLSPGSEITIQRGPSADNLIYIFRGFITNNNPKTTVVSITCRNKLWVLKQRQVSYSFDKNIDSEAGKLSEIIKTLITTYGGLNADSTTIQDSGTVNTLNKYLCFNDEVFERIMKLVDALGWQLYYNPRDDKVYCEEYGFKSYYKTLTFSNTGNTLNLVTVPELSYDYSKIVNKVTINGAKQLDTKEELFSGDASETEFTLEYVPLQTKVSVGGVEQTRGVKSGDTTTFDYWVEEDDKKIVFVSAPASGTDNISVEYSAMVPTPVKLDDPDSIELYSPTNPDTGEKTPFEKTFSFTDIIDIDDAVLRGREILSKYSIPHIRYEFQTDQSDRLFFPGMKVAIEDAFNEYTGELVVNEVLRVYPDMSDVVVLTDNRQLRTYEDDVEDRLAKLEKEALRNIGTLVTLKNMNAKPITFKSRYFKTERQQLVGTEDGTIVGLPPYCTIPNTVGGPSRTASELRHLIPGKGSFEEYIVDTEFVDTSNTTASIDTTERKFYNSGGGGLLLPTVIQSEPIFCNQQNVTSCAMTVNFSDGNIQAFVGTSSDQNTVPTSWTEITNMTSTVERGITISSGSKYLFYRIVKDYDTVIQPQTNTFGQIVGPAIRIRNIGVSS